MRNIIKYTLVIIMAVLVFYGGAGINVISYCCNQCRSAGIEALLNDKCCEIHHQHHPDRHKSDHSNCSQSHKTNHHHCNAHEAESYTYCMDHSSGNCCNMERINFDWNSQNTTELEIDLSPDVFDLLPAEIPNISTINLLICEAGTVMPKGPPLVCPRDYLSRLTTLLI